MSKKTITTYELARLIGVEITRYPKQKTKGIELVIGGEAQRLNMEELLRFCDAAAELRLDVTKKR